MLLGDILRANVPQWTLEISTRKTRIHVAVLNHAPHGVSPSVCLSSVSITLTHSRQLAHCHGHGPVTVITTRAAAVEMSLPEHLPVSGRISGRREFVFVLFLLNIV